jgi:tetratricopeptide (TPR) repeat protein
LSDLSFFDGNTASGIDNYSQLLQIDSVNYNALSNRGILKIKSEDYKGAITDLNKCIEINSNVDHTYYSRGLAYFYVSNFESAKSDFEEAIL